MKLEFYRNKNFVNGSYFHYYTKRIFMGIVHNVMCKLYVNTKLYAQFIVSTVLLFSACSSANKFENDDIRIVQSFADERKADAVLTFFNHEDSNVREQAAMAFGSLHDSLGIESLLKLAEFDKSSEVRAAAAFALGQYKMRGLRNIILRLMNEETDEMVKRELIIAVGRSLGADILIKMIDSADDYEKESLSEGVFYALVNGDTLINNGKEIVALLKNDGNTAFYAAATLNRSPLDFSSFQDLIVKAFSSINNQDTRYQLSMVIGRLATLNETLLLNLFKNEENYLTRLGFIQGNIKSNFKSFNLFSLGLSDVSPHVRHKAAEGFLSYLELPKTIDLIKISSSEKIPIIKYTLLEASLKLNNSIDQKVKISEQLSNDLQKSTNDYTSGFILKAMSVWDANWTFVENHSFMSTSILVREYGVEALIANYQSSKNPLNASYRKLIHRGLKTKDVAVSALCAEAILDATTYKSTNISEDIYLLENALNSMRLPRDNESFTSLLKAIRYLDNKPITGQIKPEFNNPINWDLTLRIPSNQQVKFHTSRGEITVELWVEDAPGSVTQFIKLIKDSFYANKKLHRVVPGFVIQDGCPRGDGFGSTMETVRSEFNRNGKFEEGTLGFASAGEDTESCQWFITHTKTPHLNGRYTAFGRVVKGMNVVHELLLGDDISRIELLAP